MGDVAVSNRVIARSAIGRFIEDCSRAAHETVREMVEEGAQLSRDMAPVGVKHDSRTLPLAQSIVPQMFSRTSGGWVATARHSLAQELGARPHTIEGNPDLSFFWEERGRRFIPAQDYYGRPGMVTVVNHPGNPPQPYLRPAYERIMVRWSRIAKRYYPR